MLILFSCALESHQMGHFLTLVLFEVLPFPYVVGQGLIVCQRGITAGVAPLGGVTCIACVK